MPKAQVISLIQMKGGVGKTTCTVNLASYLAREHQKRVLLVDFDPQTNATFSLSPRNAGVAGRKSAALWPMYSKSSTNAKGPRP